MPFATAPGARLHYETTGSGTPLVFVHETCADLRSWEDQVRWFARSHHCIAYNARGYQPSEPGVRPEDHDYQRLANDIGAVMDAAGVGQAFIVGLSMGAYVTAQFALHNADRVLGMVLAGLGGGSDDPQIFRSHSLATANALRSKRIDALMDRMECDPSRTTLAHKDPRRFAEFQAHLRELDPVGLANILEYCHSVRPPIYQFETQLRRLAIPTLVAIGDEDKACLEPALFLKRTLPNSGLWVSPRSGHAINLEEPAAFNSAVQSFIYQVEQGAWVAP